MHSSSNVTVNGRLRYNSQRLVGGMTAMRIATTMARMARTINICSPDDVDSVARKAYMP